MYANEWFTGIFKDYKTRTHLDVTFQKQRSQVKASEVPMVVGGLEEGLNQNLEAIIETSMQISVVHYHQQLLHLFDRFYIYLTCSNS